MIGARGGSTLPLFVGVATVAFFTLSSSVPKVLVKPMLCLLAFTH